MNAYHPHQSVNHIDSHDGFTLYDLVAYNQKRNWANGHGNTDGMADNHSWHSGWEGDEGAPPEVVKLREQQIKNFCLPAIPVERDAHQEPGPKRCNTPSTNSCTGERSRCCATSSPFARR